MEGERNSWERRQRMRVIRMEEMPSRFEQLWSIEQVAQHLAMSTKTLYGWRCRKYGPPSYRLGNKIRYRPAEVQSWVDEQSAVSLGR